MTDEHARLNLVRFPPVRLRIGVAGHRVPPKLPIAAIPKVRAIVDHVLTSVAEAVSQEAATRAVPRERHDGQWPALDETAPCAVVSSLAEGADRIVAEAGLASGFSLETVLPFGKIEYIKDFAAADSRAQFDDLLDRATSVFVLDGNADNRPRAYETAGFVMLANIDLLIAIWDGDDADGIGGTAQIVYRAIADGIPVVWIDPESPEALRLSWAGREKPAVAPANAWPKEVFRAAESVSPQEIRETLFPALQSEAQSSLKAFLGEREKRWNFCLWFPLLLWVFVRRPIRWADVRFPAFFSDTRAQWENYFAILPKDKAQRPAIETILLPAYSAANHLSVYYSLVYRSTYVFNYMFAAVAVALALGGIFIHEPETKSYLVLAELAVIVSILVTWLKGQKRHWHRRWLDYRRLAECLRHMRILAPVGSSGPVDRPGRRLIVDEQDWVNWYAWSLRRLLPLPNCTADAAYMAAVCDTVRSMEIAEQIRYHTQNHHRMAELDHRLHTVGQWLFGVTGALCLSFLALVWIARIPHGDDPYTELLLHVFTLVTALLPTMGAALGAIRFQGDFKTVATQSNRTAACLGQIDRLMAAEPPVFPRLVDRIDKVSDVMMADLLEWQTIFRARPLSLPA
jgi:hypothetical protein